MEYILFLITIQGPFLYFIWIMFSRYRKNNNEEVKILKEQNRNIANFLDTVRLSVEKMSEDLYGNGKVNSRMFEIEKKIHTLRKDLKEVELFTGLSSNYSKEDSSTKDQNFI